MLAGFRVRLLVNQFIDEEKQINPSSWSLILTMSSSNMDGFWIKTQFWNLQRSPLLYAPGLVKFLPAVARLLCLALPGSFLTMFAQNKVDLCTICSVVK